MARRRIQGTCHQGEINSKYAGFQCTSIAYLALVIAFLKGPPWTAWHTPTIDRVVLQGHLLYMDTIQASADDRPRYLGHWELPNLHFRFVCYLTLVSITCCI